MSVDFACPFSGLEELDDSMPKVPGARGWQKKRPSRSAEAYTRYEVPGHGYLYYAHGRQSLAAHCESEFCNHNLCRVNRSCVGSKEKYSGRPVGFPVSWLMAGLEFPGDKEGHQQLAKRQQRESYLISWEERRASREWAKKNIPEVLAWERDLEPDETEEPLHVCY